MARLAWFFWERLELCAALFLVGWAVWLWWHEPGALTGIWLQIKARVAAG